MPRLALRCCSSLVIGALVLASLTGCRSGSMSRESAPARVERSGGSLVIVGGALKEDNAAIYQRFVALAGASPRIGIIPIASGDGLKAGEASAEQWRKWLPELPALQSAPPANGQLVDGEPLDRVVVIPLTKDDAAKADDPAIAALIESCTAIWFTGGDQSRIVRVLKPETGATRAFYAVHTVLARGGVVGGTSAGAAIMSDPMITGGTSPSTARSSATTDPDNPAEPAASEGSGEKRAAGARTGPGLGYFPHGLVDQHFLQRNRLGRLIDALGDTNQSLGFGVSENCAMVVDLQTRRIEAIGAQGVCIVNASCSPPLVLVLSTGQSVTLPQKR